MMKHKKIVTLALATALTATLFTPAFADSTAGVTSPAVPLADSTQEEQIMNFDRTMGTVQEVNTEENKIWHSTKSKSIVQPRLNNKQK